MQRLTAERTGQLRAPILIWAFTALYFFFIGGPSLLDGAFPPQDGMRWGDAVDVATPFVILGGLWLLARESGTRERWVFPVLLLLAIPWAQGQGMHLSANSINETVATGASGTLPDLVEFYDEALSHYIWYAAAAALPLFLVALAIRSPHVGAAWQWAVVPAAAFGAILALSVLEADVALLGLALFLLTTLIAVVALSAGRTVRADLLLLGGGGALVAAGILIGWGAYHGGWPELSEVGAI